MKIAVIAEASSVAGGEASASDSLPRLAILMRHFSPTSGGAEAYAYRLAEQLRHRYRITAFSQTFGPPIEGVTFQQVPWVRWLPRWLNQWHYSLSTAHATREFDVVHSHENTHHGQVQTLHVQTVRSNLFGPNAKRAVWVGALKLITSPRLWFYRCIEYLRLFRVASHLVFASAELQRDTQAVFRNCAFPPQSVIAPGTNAPKLPESDAQLAAKAELAQQLPALDATRPWLLFVANDWHKKGLPCVLQALREPGLAHCQLLIIGKTEQLSQFRTQIAPFKDRIQVVGPVNNLPEFYAAATLLLHPTTQDAYPMVVLEAFGHGLPVITTGAPFNGLAAEITNNIHACVMPSPHDSKALHRAILKALTTDLTAQRQAAHQFAQTHAWPHIADQYDEIFRTIKNIAKK